MSEVFDKATEKAEEGLAGLGERLYSEYEKLPWYKQLLLAIAPVTGETISAYETPIFAEKTKEAYEQGDLLETAGHGALTGLSVLGAIPFLGAGIRGVKAGVKGARKGLRTVPAKADAPKVLTKTENTFNAALARQNPVLPINNDGTRKTMTELAKELTSRALPAPEKGKFVLGGPDKQLVQKIKKVWELEEKMNAFYAKSGIPENIPGGEFKSTLKKTPKGKKIYDELTEATEEMYRHGSPIIKEVRKGLSGLDEPLEKSVTTPAKKPVAKKIVPGQYEYRGYEIYNPIDDATGRGVPETWIINLPGEAATDATNTLWQAKELIDRYLVDLGEK